MSALMTFQPKLSVKHEISLSWSVSFWCLFKRVKRRMWVNTHATHKSIELWLYNDCHKIMQLKRSLWKVSVLRQSSHFLNAGVQHCSAFKFHRCPTISWGPCSRKSRFFRLYWLHILTISTSFIYARATRLPPRDVAFWASNHKPI